MRGPFFQLRAYEQPLVEGEVEPGSAVGIGVTSWPYSVITTGMSRPE